MKKTLLALGLLVAIAALGWTILDARSAEAIRSPDSDAGSMTAGPVDPARGAAQTNDDAGHAEPLRQALAPSAAGIALLVVDAQGLPIAGARARTFEDSIAGEATTDGEGKCALAATPGEGTMRLWIDAPGFHHVRSEQERTSRLRVSMFPTTTLAGTVLDEPTGQPIPDARVALLHGSCKGCAPSERAADAEGRYQIEDVPVGTQVLLRVDAAGHPPQKLAFRFETVAPRTQQDLRVVRGVEVSGIVVDFTTGAPVAGAAIEDRASTRLEVTRTEADGAFRAQLLPSTAGTYAISVKAPGYCTMGLRLSREELQRGEPLSIPYPRAVRFTAVLQDEAGHPIPGAEVSAESESVLDQRDRAASPLDRFPTSWQVGLDGTGTYAKTDAEGRFAAMGLAPWSRCHLSIRHPAHPETEIELDAVGAPGESLERTLTLASLGATGTVSGEVTVNGAPAQASLYGTVNGAPAEASLYWSGPTRTGGMQVRNGRYRAEHVEAGSVELHVSFGELGLMQNNTQRVVTVRAGEEITCDFALTIDFRAITGHVTRGDGSPCVGAVVSAGPHHGATTDRNGDYSIAMPSNELPHTVAVLIGGIAQKRMNVAPGTTGVDFVIPLPGRLRYRVIDRETRKPVQSFELSWRNAAGEYVTGDMGSGENEGWITHELPPGRYEGKLRSARESGETGYVQDQPESVEIRVAETTEVEVPLRPCALFRGRLAEGEQPLPQNCTLLLIEADAWEAAEWSTERRGPWWREGTRHPAGFVAERAVNFYRGRAEVRALTPGKYRFKVFGAAIAVEPEYVDVAAGVNPEIELRWHAQ